MLDQRVPEGSAYCGRLDFTANLVRFPGAFENEPFERTGRIDEANKVVVFFRDERQLVARIHFMQPIRQRATGKYSLQVSGRKVLFLEDRG